MKILITGVYGIVGSYLCEQLKNEHEVIGIGRRKEFKGCNKYYSCDITEKKELERIIKENSDLDIIIHCAALAHNKGNDLSFDRFMKVNYEATKYLVDLSNKYLKLKNFIFISTISVYGEKLNQSVYREVDVCEPRSPYAVAKKKSEEYIKENYKFNYSMLRLAPVYSKDFTLNIERRSKIKGIAYKVGDGKQRLSLCNIKNIYEAINHIINHTNTEKNEIYNIADSSIYEFNDLLDFVKGKNKKIIFPKMAFEALHKVNDKFIKKQFIHENTIKLISDNIYSSEKISKKVKMKYSMHDVEKKRKVLYVTNITRTVNTFFIPHMNMLNDDGYEVHCACRIHGEHELKKDKINKHIKFHHVPFTRNIMSIINIKASMDLCKLQKNNNFDVVHVHTPIAATYTRLLKVLYPDLKIIYTAHGYHFYKGSSKISWLVFYNIEKFLSRYTDVLITINNEDYEVSKDFRCKHLIKMNGVGVDFSEFKVLEQNEILKVRKSIGINEDDFVLIMVGEHNKNKNQIQLIKAIQSLEKTYSNIKAVFIGDGELIEENKKYIKEKNIKNCIVLGFRKDVNELINASDIGVSLSYREGLPKNVMEMMAIGKKIIATNIRGNRDLVSNSDIGTLVQVEDYKETAKVIEKYYLENRVLEEVAVTELKNEKSIKKIDDYEISKVCEELKKVYEELN